MIASQLRFEILSSEKLHNKVVHFYLSEYNIQITVYNTVYRNLLKWACSFKIKIWSLTAIWGKEVVALCQIDPTK